MCKNYWFKILKQRYRIFAECIQMVVGYLDIFVFEELGFAVGPVMDGIDGVILYPSQLV